MKALRSLFLASSLVIFGSVLCFGGNPVSNETVLGAVSGPEPVPICPPESDWCSTLGPKPKVVSGPEPVPICPPESDWCSTLGPKPKVVSGPEPVPICPPESDWCSTLGPKPKRSIV